jgi:hypothetical protein
MPAPPLPYPAPTAVPRPTAISRTACANATVYIQIFGPESLGAANGFRAPWQAVGANVPAVEDVLASARKAGRAPPRGHAEPTLIYHGDAMQACADALAATASSPTGNWTRTPLPAGLKAQPRTVEVWLPRPAPPKPAS